MRRRWKKNQKEVLEFKAESLFPGKISSDIVASFVDPARSKNAGVHEDQLLEIPGRPPEKKTVMLIRTDLKEELLYTMVIL